jgi:hypothetical protein
MIKIFVASSNELQAEREALAGCELRLNRWLVDRGEEERVSLEKWEYLDSSMGVDHKQEEYNRALRDCDAVIALFWRKFGEYTEEEFQTALSERRRGGRVRRVEVWFKGESGEETAELGAFRERVERISGVGGGRFVDVPELKRVFVVLSLELLEDEGIPMPDEDEREKYGLA